jgi:hypothetical protein
MSDMPKNKRRKSNKDVENEGEQCGLVMQLFTHCCVVFDPERHLPNCYIGTDEKVEQHCRSICRILKIPPLICYDYL